MPARTPEEVASLLGQASNAGDLQHLAVKLTHYASEIENAYSEGAPGETINAI